MHEARWVVGSYMGEQAKKILALAGEGVGYQIVENNKGSALVVAFRYAGEMPIPEHLIEIVDPLKIQKFEKTRLQRMGVEDRQSQKNNASNATIKKVREIFETTIKNKK